MSASQKEQQEREANRARKATEKKRFRHKKATEPGKRSQVLLSPRHNEESQKRGTATEHTNRSQVLLSPRHNVESRKRGTATKHAKRFVLHYNDEVQKLNEEELENRANNSHEDLQFKLNEFLAHVTRFNVFLSKLEINNEDIEDMIFEKKLSTGRRTPELTPHTATRS